MHVYRPRFYPMIAPGHPQPTNATRRKWFRSICIFSPDAIPPPPLREANAGWLTYGREAVWEDW